MRTVSSILLVGVATASISSVTAFVATSQVEKCRSSLSMAPSPNDGEIESSTIDRRCILQSLVAVGGSIAFGPKPAHAGLLDDYGDFDPKKPSVGKADVPKNAQVQAQSKEASNFEPNLRSNYYYPTNKKRYLPRIKKCNDAIPLAATMIGDGDWEGAEIFATKIADDTILPLKLYTSSLSGGGTNVKLSFVGEMTKASKDFEKAQKKLEKSIAKKDSTASSTALEELSVALLSYRTAGRLLGPDGGGDIPSVDEIRRSACRVQGRTFEKKIKARDARTREAAGVET